jgi:selenocysteine lyase/cysteine desulfurase
MLASQRADFDIPREVAYFNAAGWSPIPNAVVEAGVRGARRKAQPWTLASDFADALHERTRAAAAGLIHADPSDVALIPSVGYGVAAAAKGFPVPRGSRVLVIEDDHSAPVLEWLGRADAQGFVVETVARPADGDWTSAVVAAIQRPGAAPLAIASISSVHWSDGGAIDLDQVSKAVKAAGAALLVDATHAAGVMDLDVRRIDPDFLIFPTYKWLLGPYGRAFLYVAKRRQEAVPLEQPSYARRGVKAEQAVYLEDTRYLPDARRFDMGERDHFVSMEMAAVGIETIASYGQAAICERLSMLTGLMARRIAEIGNRVSLPDARFRAPHILSVGFPEGMPKGLVASLAAANVHAAPRIGRLRLSPHVYNDEEDIERLVSALQSAVRA